MRANYLRAISWLAHNDDCSWIDDDETCLSPAAHLVCDLWDKPARVVRTDVVKLRQRMGLS